VGEGEIPTRDYVGEPIKVERRRGERSQGIAN